MYFALDPDQRHLRASVQSFVSAHCAEDQVREAMAAAGSIDTSAWKDLTGEVGAATLGRQAPGGGFVDAAVVLEVLGAALYPGPYLGSVVAAQALRAAVADDPVVELHDELANGVSRTVVAMPRCGADRLQVQPGATPRLTGEFAAVPDAVGVDQLLVTGPAADWYVVAGGAAGVQTVPLDGFDQTRRLAQVVLAGVPARQISLTMTSRQLRERIQLVERVAVAAESAGVARHALDAGVDYAKRREQFGRPIGSFQGLQFWFADVALAVECAWSAAFAAACAVEREQDDAERASELAAATSGDAALAAAEQMLQVHGGIGFTWDNSAHLYLKRAKSNRLLWGHPDVHRARLGELLGL
jgi:alkylation response protein AidB-like acyl-CoA dehydrogenase